MSHFLLIETYLSEAFNKPLEVSHDAHRSKMYQDMMSDQLSDMSIHSTKLDGQKLNFYKFKRDNAWEVHYENETKGAFHSKGGLKDKHQTIKILSTAVGLMKPHIEAGEDIRLQAREKEKYDAFLKVAQHLVKTRGSSYKIKELGYQPSAVGMDLHTLLITQKS